MSYRVYIKKDYKPEIRWYPDLPWYLQKKIWFISLGLFSLIAIYYLMEFPNFENISQAKIIKPVQQVSIDDLTQESVDVVNVMDDYPVSVTVPDTLPASEHAAPASDWQSVTVNPHENLSIIFDRLHLSPAVLFKVMSAGKDTDILKRLDPGDQILFQIEHGDLIGLRYEPDLTTALLVSKNETGYTSKIIISELESRARESSGIIKDSLFLAGQDAGLSDNLIMRLVSIFGWDIDFALNIRKGDSFKVIFEEKFKQGIKVAEGPILAAEFVNRGKIYKAVRYTSPDDETGFYNEDGYSMRKAFLRTPLTFSRISSKFNLNRKHPILNKIRAHKGVDYAAPAGTPVKATGDGTVVSIGRNGGYGNMIVLRHGGIYNTAYAHLSRYAKGLKKGQKVKQGDTIGYVGSTGLATGPHLHYEFRVNGVHHNPLTVILPKALKIPESQMAHFQEHTKFILAQLDNYSDSNFADSNQNNNGDLILASRKTGITENP